MSIGRRLHALRRKVEYLASDVHRRMRYRAKRHRFGGYDIEVRWHAPRMRLDTYLDRVFGHVHKREIRQAIERASVLVDMRPVDTGHRIRMYERIQILEPRFGRLRIRGVDLGIQTLWEDTDLVVVDKPPQMLTHPNIDLKDPSVIAHLAHLGKLYEPEIFTFEAGVVHRLDHPTSGVLCVARTERGFRSMRKLFRQRRVEKTYLALVRGCMEGSGIIDQPIGRVVDDPKRRCVDPERGKRSITTYQVLETGDEATLVKLGLLTGRTHQLRVHLAHLGHPVVGDRTYGRRRQPRTRVFLHAWRLGFRHPLSGDVILAEAPVPQEFYAYPGFRLGTEGQTAKASGVPNDKSS